MGAGYCMGAGCCMGAVYCMVDGYCWLGAETVAYCEPLVPPPPPPNLSVIWLLMGGACY